MLWIYNTESQAYPIDVCVCWFSAHYFRLSLRRIGPFTSPPHLSFTLASMVASVHDETRNHVFPFRWFSSRFLLDGPSFFYHLMSTRQLFLCAWFCPFSTHVLTISTLFVWWQCLFYFHFCSSSSYLLVCYPLWSVYLLYSPQAFMHE